MQDVDASEHERVCKNAMMKSSMESYVEENPETLRRLIDIVNGRSKVSLRILDWFVTNYARERDLVYVYTTKDLHVRRMIVFSEYRQQLRAYSKKRFVPFCRRERMEVVCPTTGQVVYTTIAQLNFFRWAVQRKLLDYVEEHVVEIARAQQESVHTNRISKAGCIPPTDIPRNLFMKNNKIQTSCVIKKMKAS